MRVLRHWDALGVVSPERTPSGHRVPALPPGPAVPGGPSGSVAGTFAPPAAGRPP
ncbi:hypothetical protein AB0M98_28200 [Streptomyces sp. NPDC051135]|uniref:hypothetical protein n=1 Tax=Streptomyces sp. NPDC051135 TaxID=3155668 RepID=UPI00343F2D83